MSKEELKQRAALSATEVEEETDLAPVEEAVPTEVLPVQADPETDTLPVVSGPVKVVEFHGQEVPVYEVNGDLYLTGEDLGKILGLADHRDSVNNIFNRHRPELDMHSTTIKLRGRDWKARSVRLYSQDGYYLISMFARTDTAKDVRQWLAALPRQVRQIQAIAPELLAQVRQDDIEEVAFRMLNLLNTPAGSKIGLKKMERLTRLRAKGLVTQKEASKMHEISVEAARHIEREMGAILGLEIKPINPFERDREMNRAFATMLAKSFAMDLEATVATPATPREKKKMH